MNSTVGDLSGNFMKMSSFYSKAATAGADIVVFPELSITGYPPLDLLERKDFIEASASKASDFARLTKGNPACIFGFVFPNHSTKGKRILNCAAFAAEGKIKKIVGKTLLPTYDIFDEARYFEPWSGDRIVTYMGKKIAITVCEDIWAGTSLLPHAELYEKNPLKDIIKKRPDLLINISASPFHKNKGMLRKKILSSLARRYSLKTLYLNCVGANDELIFDGGSFFISDKGKLLGQGEAFRETELFFDTESELSSPEIPRDDLVDIKNAIVLGIKDYFSKQGFSKAVIGLSGGIDSAVVASLAVEALGAENVTGILMPSQYTSIRSVRDALKLAKNLKIKTETKHIGRIYSAFISELGLSGNKVDLAKQNLQSRIRGTILMAYSNSSGCLVLTTGNKSEISMGYCTLYGDTAGAIAPIGDLLKTEVYALAKVINSSRDIIPRSIIVRPPTAELKPGQKDQDDLPPYSLLDRIIKAHVEDSLPFHQVASLASNKALAESVVNRIENNEYKRKQLPMCLKVSQKSFGSGRKMPVVKKYLFSK